MVILSTIFLPPLLFYLAPLLILTISSQVSASANHYADSLQSHQIPLINTAAYTPCQSSTNLPSHIFHHLAQYSPWFPAGKYPDPPQGCSIDQVNIIHRHSSRYPTAGAGRIIEASIDRLQEAIQNKGKDSSLAWMLDYQYTLGADDLVQLGIRE